METKSITIERKELINLYIAYLQTHTYIKSRCIAWNYFQPYNFSRTQLKIIIPKLSRKLQYFCKIALENKIIIRYTTSIPSITYKIENIGNISLLKEKLGQLKEKTFEFEIPFIISNHHSKN